MDSKMVDVELQEALIAFHKCLENEPQTAVHWYAGIVDHTKYANDISVAEDCAQVLAQYIKNSSEWKQRYMAECIQDLYYPAKILILKHFTDFELPGFSIDLVLSENAADSGDAGGLELFQKSKMSCPGMVFGRNVCGKLGIGAGIRVVTKLTPLDFQFNLAFLGNNHAIFWKSSSGEVWACGKSENFLRRAKSLEIPDNYTRPIKLDYVEFMKERPIIEMGDNYTKFINYTEETTLFVGNPIEKEKILKAEKPENVENGVNCLKWTRKDDDVLPVKTSVSVDYKGKPVTVSIRGYHWECAELAKSGRLVHFMCGRRVPELVGVSVCADGSVWYRDECTLYKGSLHFADNHEHLVASLREIPFHMKIGGFSVAPDGQSIIIFTNRKNRHVEEFHPRPQVDFSTFIQLTYDPWRDYICRDIQKTIKNMDRLETFLRDKYTKSYNEYGFVCDNVETLKAIDNLYHLIRVRPGEKMPAMMLNLAEFGSDQMSQHIIVNAHLKNAEEAESLRVRVEPGDMLFERVVAEAQRQIEHKIRVIRAGLQTLKALQLSDEHEGIWTYLKFTTFIGHYEIRWKGGKGRFEEKEPMVPCFQTRDIAGIVKRRAHTRRLLDSEDDGLKDLVKVQAVAHRSDVTKMNVFYLYPIFFFVLKPFVEAMNPGLLNRIDEHNVLDLNDICDRDRDNFRFVSLIQDVSGCGHQNDFKNYKRRISLDRIVFYHPDVYTVQTTDGKIVKVPKILFRLFSILSIDSEEFKLNARGDLVVLGMEALLDMREILEVSTFVKYELFCFYTHALFLEASSDVLKMIVLTGEEEDVHVFRRLFASHPKETTEMLTRFRPEILILWTQLPVPAPQLRYLEKIYEYLSYKRRFVKPLPHSNFVLSREEVLACPVSPDWLRGHFSRPDLDSETGVIKAINKYLKE